MKPAYTPQVRIYRGQRRRTAEGACPVCDKVIAATTKGVRREHRDKNGLACPGSGVRIGERAVTPLDLDKVLAALPQHAPVQLDAPKLPRHMSTAERRKEPGRCEECGQNPRVNKDGTLRAHRMEPDTFTGPYCPGGGGQPRYRTESGGRFD